MHSFHNKNVKKATFAPLGYLDLKIDLYEATELTKNINIESRSGAFGAEKFELWKDYLAIHEQHSR